MFAQHQPSDTPQLPLRCMYCSTEERLNSSFQVQKGDHIKLAGEKGLFNFGKKQIKFYSHHAIIKDVQPLNEDGSAAILKLIQFMSTPFDSSLNIRETVEVKHFGSDEIYVIKYRHKNTYPPEEIVQRGEKLIHEGINYSGLYCNCEHLAHWCACGNEGSLQAESFFERIRDMLKAALSFFAKVIGLTIDDILLTSSFPVVGDIFLVIIILVVLIYSITEHRMLNKLVKDGDICEPCCKVKQRDIWIRFVVLLTLQAGGLFLTNLIPIPGIRVVFGLLISILTVLLMKYIPKWFRKICSPFGGQKLQIDSFHKISVGDIVSWKYKGFYHDGIVSSLKITPKTNEKKADVTVIHYALPGIFAKREIIEETISLDLNKEKLRLHDYTGYDVNEAKTVVERARKRVGETKFGLTHRSAHLCHWAKLKDKDDDDIGDTAVRPKGSLTYSRPADPELDFRLPPVYIDHRRNRPFASKEIRREYAKIQSDLKPGQLIQFTYRHLPHQAVCTDVRPGSKPSGVEISVVHYGNLRTVSEENFSFDLNTNDILIIKVHPVYKFGSHAVVRRARAKIGNKRGNILYNRSSHLAEEIVYKEKDRRVFSYSEISPGDCITYKYWWLPHDAVVVDVKPKQTKGNDEGYLTLVHYALDSLFGTRYIKKETVYFNLSKNMITLKSFPKAVVYPKPLVVQRVLSRIGEKKFHIRGNISSDVVHWAKVVQVPCIVAITPFDDEKTPDKGGERQENVEYLLLPRVGKPFDHHFQKDWIKTWDEIIPGLVVEYAAIRGIVSEVNTEDKTVKVIQNKINAREGEVKEPVGTVREVNIKLDLCTQYLYVYRCEPNVSNKPSVCTRKAKSMLNQTVVGISEWGFCKTCVVSNAI